MVDKEKNFTMNGKSIGELTVLFGIERCAAIKNFIRYRISGLKSDRTDFLRALYAAGGEKNFSEFIGNVIVTDENAFSECCAKGVKPSDFVERAYESDLKLIFIAINSDDTQGEYCKGSFCAPLKDDPSAAVKTLKKFYARNGYGKFIYNAAFVYADGRLEPVTDFAEVQPQSLKNYVEEKRQIENNTENFLKGLPYSHMLLYGDMGTGKSSTVHATVTKYRGDGLRIIEIKKEDVLQIPRIMRLISGNPLKFMLFIDDLSLDENDDKISGLKAALEGSLSSTAENAMIVATSNRRHIVKESFSGRENAVNPNESMQEQLSLADRFGLTVSFSQTNKENYLSIVAQLADDMKITADREKLCALAERWAVIKGGRSPRRAKQFIDFVYSAEVNGTEIDF